MVVDNTIAKVETVIFNVNTKKRVWTSLTETKDTTAPDIIDSYSKAIEPSIEIEKMGDLNQQILETATSLALSEQAELHIVYAWMVFGEELLQSSHSEHLEEEVFAWMKAQKNEIKAGLNEFGAKLNQALDENGSDCLHPEVHILEGDAYDIIPRLAEEQKVDLVIMGTVARTGLPGFFMGNTAESILNQLNCSVLNIKPEGFVSPVTI